MAAPRALKLIAFAEQSTILSNLAQPMIPTRATPDISQATHNATPLLDGDSANGTMAVPPEKERLPAISWFIGLFLRHTSRLAIYVRALLIGVARRRTFLSTIILYVVMVGVTASVSRWSFQDGKRAARKLPLGKNGVSFVPWCHQPPLCLNIHGVS